MDFLLSGLALLLLVLPGCLFVSLVVPRQRSNRPLLIAGHGTIAGLFIVPLLMRLVDFLGLSLTFSTTSTAIVLLCLVLLGVRLHRKSGEEQQSRTNISRPSLDRGAKVIIALWFGLILVRVLGLGLEVMWRPLFPWDATMHWATKAKVWFEHSALVPFVDNQSWLEHGGGGVYTDFQPGYPKTIPLLQLWMSLAIGRWDESLMNLPWLACFVGLGAAFYAQAREAGIGAVACAGFTYLLLSLPLLNTQIALAGYADPFLATSYCLALMALHNWSISRHRWQAALAAVFGLSCILIKNEGLYWSLTLIPALVPVLFPGKRSLLILSTLFGTAVIVFLLLPDDFEIAGHSLVELKPHYQPEALNAILYNLFLHDSWHLLAYLSVALIILACWLARPALKDHASILVALASATGLYLFLFLFSNFAESAVMLTGVGRITLHLAPAYMFVCALLYNALVSVEREEKRGLAT